MTQRVYSRNIFPHEKFIDLLVYNNFNSQWILVNGNPLNDGKITYIT